MSMRDELNKIATDAANGIRRKNEADNKTREKEINALVLAAIAKANDKIRDAAHKGEFVCSVELTLTYSLDEPVKLKLIEYFSHPNADLRPRFESDGYTREFLILDWRKPEAHKG